MSATYEGGCHCGAVRFRVRVDEHLAYDCNCSICTKKGYLHLIVAADAFELLQGADALSEYRFQTRVAVHRFCRVCGVQAFYTPRSHPDGVDVNVRCLEPPSVIERFEVVPFDGQNWEANVDSIRDVDY